MEKLNQNVFGKNNGTGMDWDEKTEKLGWIRKKGDNGIG